MSLRITKKNERINNALILLCIICFVAIVAFISKHVSDIYYDSNIYHYDSAAYRMSAVRTYLGLKSGSIKVFDILSQKECLDVLLRAILYKKSLLMEYGHLLVSSLFMVIGCYSLFNYCYSKNKLIFLSLIPVFVSVIFPFYYLPNMGYADYYKESVAVWILMGAIMSYLRSDNLNNKYWALLSGSLWAMLFFQRSILAVLFVPGIFLLILVYFKKIKDKAGSIAFIFPVVLSIAVLSSFQFSDLLAYYTITVDSSNVSFINNIYYIIQRMPLGTGTAIVVYSVIISMIVYNKTRISGDFVKLLILLTVFSAVVFVKAPYHSYLTVVIFFLIMFLGVLISECKRARAEFVALMLAVVALGGYLQYSSVLNQIKLLSQNGESQRKIYEAVSNVVASSGLKKPVSLFLMYDEATAPFDNFLFFRKKLTPGRDYEISGFVSIHDSYYRRKYGGLSRVDILQRSHSDNVSQISKAQTPVLVSYCNSNDIYVNSPFLFDGNDIAATSVYLTNSFIEKSSDFRAVSVVNDNGRMICVRVPKAITESQ